MIVTICYNVLLAHHRTTLVTGPISGTLYLTGCINMRIISIARRVVLRYYSARALSDDSARALSENIARAL